MIEPVKGEDDPTGMLDLFNEIADLATIREENLFTEVKDHTQRCARIAKGIAETVDATLSLKNAIKRRRAAIWEEQRKKKKKTGLTNPDIAALQDLDEEVIELEDSLVIAETAKTYLQSMDRHFQDRSSLVINLRRLMEAEAK